MLRFYTFADLYNHKSFRYYRTRQSDLTEETFSLELATALKFTATHRNTSVKTRTYFHANIRTCVIEIYTKTDEKFPEKLTFAVTGQVENEEDLLDLVGVYEDEKES